MREGSEVCWGGWVGLMVAGSLGLMWEGGLMGEGTWVSGGGENALVWEGARSAGGGGGGLLRDGNDVW